MWRVGAVGVAGGGARVVSQLRARVPQGALDGLRPGQTFRLDGPEARRLIRVARARSGEVLELFDGAGRAVRGRISRVEREELFCRVEQAVRAPDPAMPLVLVQAAIKGDRMEMALEKATELGATAIWVVLTSRCVARPDGSGGRFERFRRVVEAAARQCGRASVPAVRGPLAWDQAAQELARCGPGWLKVVAWEGAQDPMTGVLEAARHHRPEGAVACVGPEGGLTEEEVRRMEAAGARTASLGPRVLRAETAAATLLALIQAFVGDLRSDSPGREGKSPDLLPTDGGGPAESARVTDGWATSLENRRHRAGVESDETP